MEAETGEFLRFFRLRLAVTPTLKRASYELRHQVYCEELGWEPVNPSREEIDAFDHHSVALLLERRRTHEVIGTIRVIIPPVNDPQKRLPFEFHCNGGELLEGSAPTEGPGCRRLGEVSRLALKKGFRKLRDSEDGISGLSEEEWRSISDPASGLYVGTAALADCLGLRELFIIATPGLRKRLEHLGLPFTQRGEAFEHRGTRVLSGLPRRDYYRFLPPAYQDLYFYLRDELSCEVRVEGAAKVPSMSVSGGQR